MGLGEAKSMSIGALSRRSLIASGLAVGGMAAFAPAFAQHAMTAEKMRALIDYAFRRNKEDNKAPITLGNPVSAVLFGRSDEMRLFQIGNDEGAFKERFSVTVDLPEQRVVLFSRTDEKIYFHVTGMHLRRERSGINERGVGVSLWTSADAAPDFDRQMTYWAGRSSA
jgi:hypothetical protein